MAEQTPEQRQALEALALEVYGRCPRCGGVLDRPAMNSLSRVDGKTAICGNCGTAESIEDYYRSPEEPMTKERWVVKGE